MEQISNLEISERYYKAIPSIVYFNYFAAIARHLKESSGLYDLKSIPFYKGLPSRNVGFDINRCKRLLWNSWSTEHALLFPQKLKDSEYYRYSFQWGFPQAYYAVYLNMLAFREAFESANYDHNKGINVFGSAVKDRHYPKAISFFASGLHEEFKYHNLPGVTHRSKIVNSLTECSSLEEARTQIAAFLKSTRERTAQEKRQRLQASNDERFRSKSGGFLKAFRKIHWDRIYKKMPVTSVMSLLYRLRIKANYHDIESFVNADVDFAAFHSNLSSIVDYLNYIHEAYLMKVIGEGAYKEMRKGFPKQLINDTALRRYELMQANM